MPRERKHGTTTILPTNRTILREMGFLPSDPYPPAKVKTRNDYGLGPSQRTNVNNRLKHALDQEHGAYTSDYYRLLCRIPADRDLDSLRQAIHWSKRERARLGIGKAPMRHRDSEQWISEDADAKADFEQRQAAAKLSGKAMPNIYPAPTKPIVEEVPVKIEDLRTVVSHLIKRQLDRERVLNGEYPWQRGIGKLEPITRFPTGGKRRMTIPKHDNNYDDNDDTLSSTDEPTRIRDSFSAQSGSWSDPNATESDENDSLTMMPTRKRRMNLANDEIDAPESPPKRARLRPLAPKRSIVRNEPVVTPSFQSSDITTSEPTDTPMANTFPEHSILPAWHTEAPETATEPQAELQAVNNNTIKRTAPKVVPRPRGAGILRNFMRIVPVFRACIDPALTYPCNLWLPLHCYSATLYPSGPPASSRPPVIMV